MELWQFSNDKGVRSQATLLTRNLCFYGPTKTLLASNGSVQCCVILWVYSVKHFVYNRELLGTATVRIKVPAG